MFQARWDVLTLGTDPRKGVRVNSAWGLVVTEWDPALPVGGAALVGAVSLRLAEILRAVVSPLTGMVLTEA